MAEATTVTSAVPVLFVSEPIVLPGMVVPIELDDAARAAVDAAQASESGKLLIAPRLDDRYPTYGVLASIVQVGRVPGGGAAAVVRGDRRAHIGSGTTGPGAALWVEVTEVDEDPATEATRRWPPSTRSCCWRCCSGAKPGRSSTWSTSSPTRRSWPTPPAMRRT